MAAAEATHSAAQTPASPTAPEKPTVDEFPTQAPRVSFWQKPFVQRVLPFLTSLLLHIGLVIVIWATYTVAETVYTIVKEQIIIPDSMIVEDGPVGGVQNVGLGEDPTREGAQDQFADVPAHASGWSSSPSQTLESTLVGGGGPAGSDTMIGVGTGGGMGPGDGGIGTGAGTGGGPAAPFGVPGGGQGIGPKSQFMGVGGNAVKIVYVCDASGSMLNSMAALRQQLNRSISELKPVQAFNVIFFNEEIEALQASGLIMANANNKRRAFDFIQGVAPRRGTDPFPAIKAAFDTKPELIYLLSDGFEALRGTYDDVYRAIQQYNPTGKVKINTIFIARSENPDPLFIDAMQKIARDNGGRFVTVPADEMY